MGGPSQGMQPPQVPLLLLLLSFAAATAFSPSLVSRPRISASGWRCSADVSGLKSQILAATAPFGDPAMNVPDSVQQAVDRLAQDLEASNPTAKPGTLSMSVFRGFCPGADASDLRSNGRCRQVGWELASAVLERGASLERTTWSFHRRALSGSIAFLCNEYQSKSEREREVKGKIVAGWRVLREEDL